MLTSRQTSIPSLVRVKPGALDRIGVYLDRYRLRRAAVVASSDLPGEFGERLKRSFGGSGIEIAGDSPVGAASFEEACGLFADLPRGLDAVVGLGGGKALDAAKYLAHLSRLPYFAVPTSLSNDGFCSPQSSLTVGGRRRSLPSAMPFGVVVDTGVCLGAPEILWHSGVGDLIAKFTAVADWKLAFHAVGEPVDDFAALLSDASVYQFFGHPGRDLEGLRLLGSALLLNGISMGICGSSRPASGSEHLISHALDSLSERPRLHGLQVGVAAYLVSLLQGQNSEAIARVFEATGFWRAIEKDPFDRAEWIEAARLAPGIKAGFYTVLSSRDCIPEIRRALGEDPLLNPCFTG